MSGGTSWHENGESTALRIRDYLRLLRRRWLAIAAALVVCVAAAAAYVVFSPTSYTASVQLFVATAASDNAAQLASGNAFAEARVQSYTTVANGPAITGPVIQLLHLKVTPAQLAGRISADAPLNKVLVNIHVTDHVPVVAANIANAVATQFASYVQTLEAINAQANPPVMLTVIHPAKPPTAPSAPRRNLDIAIGVLAGLVLGIALAIALEAVDTKIRVVEDLGDIPAPALAAIPIDKAASRFPIAFRADVHGTRAEAFRQLRTNLQFVDVDKRPRVIVVTSAMPGDGKTTTALNLAAALAEAGRRVCLVDADFRRPTVATRLGLLGELGYTTAIVGQASAEELLQDAGHNLRVLTSGPVPPNPSELLASRHAREVITSLAAANDYVIIDSAPLIPVADGAEITTMAEATILVVRSRKTTAQQAYRAAEILQRVGESIAGVVLNMAPPNKTLLGTSTYYTYSSHRPSRRHSLSGPRGPNDDWTAEPLLVERVLAAHGAHSSLNGGSDTK
jgi:capsular exopolysaccharide synthesis family protein